MGRVLQPHLKRGHLAQRLSVALLIALLTVLGSSLAVGIRSLARQAHENQEYRQTVNQSEFGQQAARGSQASTPGTSV